uniref:Uncharacterized protein n=1 Tax=Oryza glumipatula TaxID=40148 RepID=A0A0E0BM66_9ORYZ
MVVVTSGGDSAAKLRPSWSKKLISSRRRRRRRRPAAFVCNPGPATATIASVAFPVDMFTADRAWRSGCYMLFFNAALDKQSDYTEQCPQCGESSSHSAFFSEDCTSIY